jgi:hypothetical protein
MNHDPHLGFVIAAYALALVIVAGMAVTIIADYINLKRALASFAARASREDVAGQKLNRLDVTQQNPNPEGFV